jgi:hypothetical protein
LVPVPTERDLGTDAFVQVTDELEKATGEVFGVQVKSGTTYLRAKGGAVPVDEHGSAWRNASVPIIGIVHNPDTGEMWWVNLTEALMNDPSMTWIPATEVLPAPDQDPMPFLRSVRLSTDFRGGLPRGLGSFDEEEQMAAVWQCFALGFQSPNALVALRRILVSLHPSARWEAANALSLCIAHPDRFYTGSNYLPSETRSSVAGSMRWSPTEVHCLLGLIGEEGGVDRGSMGQTIYLLIYEDPDSVRLLRKVAEDNAPFEPQVAGWAAYLAVANAEEPVREWSEMLKQQPWIRATFVSESITHDLDEYGFLSLS